MDTRPTRETSDERYHRHLMRKYGLSLGAYREMLKRQKGKCAICRKPPDPVADRGRLCVDHDHEDGTIRGLLCHTCNRKLGEFEKNYDRYTAYLEGATVL